MADENVIYIPIHNQVLNWGISDGWSTGRGCRRQR
jgi:peptide/nickel transport system substrate-binding protein